MGPIYDQDAAKRSVMLKQKSLCNGERTGRACVHYWAHWEKVESYNVDSLRRGEIFRVCLRSPGIAHEMSADQVATECNQYKPMRLAWYLRPLAWLGLVQDPGVFDDGFEQWNPMTPEEIKKSQEEVPLAENLVKLTLPERKKELSLDEAFDQINSDNSNSGEGIFAKEGEK